MARIVETLQDTIDIIDFWKKPIEVKNLRGKHRHGDSAGEYSASY